MALLGAGGGIGQPLALLLKMVGPALAAWMPHLLQRSPELTVTLASCPQNKLVTELALYDVVGTAGVAADISHCNTPIKASAGRLLIELGREGGGLVN